MPGTAIRKLGVAAALLALQACAQVGQPLRPLGVAEVGEAPAPHHNLWFHHASYVTSVAPARPPRASAPLSSRSPISDICANAQAKAVLDKDLPGLTSRPEFDFFKHMSLQTLKKMSGGKMTEEDVAKVDADLAQLPPPAQTASIAP